MPARFDAKEFESYVKLLMERHDAPGLAVGIVSNRRVIYARGFGYRDREKGLPVTTKTIFGIASVSKSFTALAITQLSDRGLLNINDSVVKYLPEFKIPGNCKKVTLHNFLTHTAGIPPLPSLDWAIIQGTNWTEEEKKRLAERLKVEMKPCVTPEQLMEFIGTHDYKLLGEPGQYVSYSNDAYGLLGTVIERVSGTTYERYLRENILDPLEMYRTTTDLEFVKAQEDVTSLYWRPHDDKVEKAFSWQEAPAFTACGFIRSNVEDLLQYLRMYLNAGVYRGKRLVSRVGLSRMLTPYYNYTPEIWYGYGFGVRPQYAGKYTVIQHSGSLRGVASHIGFIPELNAGAVVLCNLTGFPASKVWLAAMNVLAGLPVDNPLVSLEEVKVPREHMAKFAGRYVSGEGADIKIVLGDEGLVADIDGKKFPVKITGMASGSVTIRGVESHARFYFEPSGNVWAMGYGSRMISKVE